MPLSKIVLYFTPDAKEINRGKISFEQSRIRDRGAYEISLNHPVFIDGSCSALKSAIKNTATLNFKSMHLGVQTQHIFKVNDYIEIWDIAKDWCMFRGVVKQTTINYQGDRRQFSVRAENAGGWALGDNSIYYLRQKAIIDGKVTPDIFKEIKAIYGWLGSSPDFGTNVSASKLLDVLIEDVCNKRIQVLNTKFYPEHQCAKTIETAVDSNLEQKEYVVAKEVAKMEGSIIQVMRMFEGRPFSEFLLYEGAEKTKLLWRNSRWRDYRGELCMGTAAGTPKDMIFLHEQPGVEPANREKEPHTGIKEFAGVISKSANRTNDNVVNAVFVFPKGMSTNQNVPASFVMQADYDPDKAAKLIDTDSIIRHGYKPITLDLPFVPDTMSTAAFNKLTSPGRRKSQLGSADNLTGEFLSAYSEYALAMYKNIQDALNGSLVYAGILDVTVADDFLLNNKDGNTWIDVHQITWHLDASAYRTVLEFDRGFEV